MTIYASLGNVTPSKENIDWPLTSTLTSHDHIINLDQLPKFDHFIDVVERDETTVNDIL